MPAIANSIPSPLCIGMALVAVDHPIATIMHVLRCPTTVLETAEDPAMIKNWLILMRTAASPDIPSKIHSSVLIFPQMGMVSKKGTRSSSSRHPMGACLCRSCIELTCSFGRSTASQTVYRADNDTPPSPHAYPIGPFLSSPPASPVVAITLTVSDWIVIAIPLHTTARAMIDCSEMPR